MKVTALARSIQPVDCPSDGPGRFLVTNEARER